MSGPARVLPLVLVITLGGCKLARNEEQTDRELPLPEPSAAFQPSKPAEPAAPAARARDADRTPPRPTATSPEPSPRPTSPAAPAPAPSPADTAPSPTPTDPPVATPGAAGAPAVTLNPSCLPKCQSTLQACVSKPPALDGGLPSLESMAECRKAFDDCRKECGI